MLNTMLERRSTGIPWGTHKDSMETQTWALGREERLSRIEWERKQHMKGIEVLILLFLGGREEASVSMDKQQRGGGQVKLVYTSQLNNHLFQCYGTKYTI